MPDIYQLPVSVINKIAAGEVIERPASVVKELVENSVDAGARRIEVTLGQGGGELIRVADDGCGIAADQLSLAIASHATSKIREADDLFHVGTLGFRGEALASIAEVSRFRIVSRPADALAGAQLEVLAGQRGTVEPCGCGVGTTIEVRDLFCNTPVRRKFLRTAGTEIAHATEAFTRIALAHPDRHFVLRHNERVLYDLAPTTHWPERIAAFFGADLGAALIAVASEDGAVRLSGYVADPNFNRGNNRLQYLFLNGRCIRDRSLQHALTEAYRGLLLTGRFPIAFLRLEMPLDLVDVNVHPTKMEVRFQDSGRIYSQLLGAIRRKFLSTDLTPRVGPGEAVGKSGGAALRSTGGVTAVPATIPEVSRAAGTAPGVSGEAQDESSGAELGLDAAAAGPREEGRVSIGSGESRWRLSPATSPAPATPSLFDASRAAAHRQQVVAWAQGQATVSGTQVGSAGGATPVAPWETGDEKLPPRGAPAVPLGARQMERPSPTGLPDRTASSPRGVQLHNRYLVAEVEEGVVVIDQHALHERILYEQLRAKVLAGKLETQGLLVPETVSLLPAESAVVLDARDTLAQLGLTIEPFGGGTWLVTSYPAMLGRTRVGELVRQVVDLLLAGAKSPESRDLVDELLHMMSCKAAVKAGDRLTPDEVTALLEQRHLFQDTHHCPHGRPTALVFTLEELDKRFKRT
ncbi:MAG: DNA mismatch repair endonuclease MutL [Pirellulales bacterium]